MNPIIIPINETKNFLEFQEIFSGQNFSIEKPDFIKAVASLTLWKDDNFATNFSAQLFRLLAKADCCNMRRFLIGFPTETIVYLLWYHSDTEEEFWQKWGNVEIKDIEPIITNPESELCQEVKRAQIRNSIYETK